MKLKYTLAALAATTLAANAATYVVYDAGAGPAADPNTGAPWGTWSASGGVDTSQWAAETTGSGAAAWGFGDALQGTGSGDALYYDFLAGTTELTDMLANGFVLSITMESVGTGGFVSLGDASNVLGGGSLRYGATPGATAGGIETLTFTWNPGDSGPASNFGTVGAGSGGNWISAANGLRLNMADNTSSTSAWHMRLNNITVTTVPEPSSTALLGLGGLALILRRRK